MVDRDDVPESFWTAFSAANRALAAGRDDAFARHGVAAGQSAILSRLWISDGQSPGELARALDLATSTVTSTATKMETAGLLRRVTTDARQVTLQLTGRGRELEKIIDREMRTLGERALGSLTDTERAQLVRLLRQVRAGLTG